jgi:hypothetical protein
MRIALRTSGGRGEYEFSGKQGSVGISEVLGKEIYYELTPELILPGFSKVQRVQGKPRIRLDDLGIHAYRLLSAVLLLPKSIRELNKTPTGKLSLSDNNFSIISIQIDIVALLPDRIIVRPTDLIFANRDQLATSIPIEDRISRIFRIWEFSRNKEGNLEKLIDKHRDTVLASVIDHSSIEKTSKNIRVFLNTNDDLLSVIEQKLLGVCEENKFSEVVLAAIPDEDQIEPKESAKRILKRWRNVKVRGVDEMKFRSQINEAYNFTCLFSGLRLPKTSFADSPGVDAAHILPWATYNINSVNNGICLTKTCHWAFDCGIFKLDFNNDDQSFNLSIPPKIIEEAKKYRLNLRYFQSMVGVLPKDRLPRAREKWPNSKYLESLNKILSG